MYRWNGGAVHRWNGMIGGFVESSRVTKSIFKLKPDMDTRSMDYMTHYEVTKQAHPDAIVFVHKGAFYSTYKQDAISCSELLSLSLTKVGEADQVKFSHSLLDTYVPKLLKEGRYVVICDEHKASNFESCKDINKRPEYLKDETTGLHYTKEKIYHVVDHINDFHDFSDLEEPPAHFFFTMPEEAKLLGCHIDKDGLKTYFDTITIQPGLGQLIAKGKNIVTVLNIECDGIWPDGDDFVCQFDPRSISGMAGYPVSVAVWYKDDKKYVTSADGGRVFMQWEEEEFFKV